MAENFPAIILITFGLMLSPVLVFFLSLAWHGPKEFLEFRGLVARVRAQEELSERLQQQALLNAKGPRRVQ